MLPEAIAVAAKARTSAAARPTINMIFFIVDSPFLVEVVVILVISFIIITSRPSIG
jgi:hypothetical protein